MRPGDSGIGHFRQFRRQVFAATPRPRGTAFFVASKRFRVAQITFSMNLLTNTLARLRGRKSHNAIGPIGIDFALEAINLVQLEDGANGRPRVRARASLPYASTRKETLAEPLQFQALLGKAFSADDFHGRRCVMAVPSDSFRTVSINYKSGADSKQEAAAVLDAMKSRLDGNLENYVLDYLPVRSRTKSDDRLALVAISERAPIMALLENARKSRLDVHALEIGPVAVSRLIGAYYNDADPGNVMVINSGRRASFLTLLCGSDLLFDQEVGFSEMNLVRQVAEALDMPEDMTRGLILRTGIQSSDAADAVADAVEEASLVSALSEILKPHFMSLVEDIKRVFQYAAAETRGGAVAKVYLLGSLTRWPGSDSLISSLTGVEVLKMPDPLSMFATGDAASAKDLGHPVPELSVAAGLALRGIHAHE